MNLAGFAGRGSCAPWLAGLVAGLLPPSLVDDDILAVNMASRPVFFMTPSPPSPVKVGEGAGRRLQWGNERRRRHIQLHPA